MKKYYVTFAQQIMTTVEIMAENEDQASDLAQDIIDNGEVEFTEDSVASACGEIDIIDISEED